MVLSARKIVRRLKLIVLFLFLTFCLYKGLVLVQEWIQPVDKYREPVGRAIKVFGVGAEEKDIIRREALRDGGISAAEQLKRFYRIGE